MSTTMLSDVKRKMRNSDEERMNIIEYYNNSPDTDLIADVDVVDWMCEDHKDVPYCTKCLLVHDDQHKCYVYDRLFAGFMGQNPHLLFSHEKLKHFDKYYNLDYKKGRYTLEWNDVSESIVSIWIDGQEFIEDCCFMAQRYYDWDADGSSCSSGSSGSENDL
jgi:hypothetical protein